jgi:hypothetical protein
MLKFPFPSRAVLVGRLVGCLIGWSVDLSVGGSVGRSVRRSVGWLVGYVFTENITHITGRVYFVMIQPLQTSMLLLMHNNDIATSRNQFVRNMMFTIISKDQTEV